MPLTAADLPELATPAEVVDVLRLPTRRSLRTLKESGELLPVRVAGHPRYRRNDVIAYLDNLAPCPAPLHRLASSDYTNRVGDDPFITSPGPTGAQVAANAVLRAQATLKQLKGCSPTGSPSAVSTQERVVQIKP